VTTAWQSEPAASTHEPSPRPKFTSRAAVLAVVICAIALSLAYPIREYIAERHQIDQLETQNAQIAVQVRQLRAEQRKLSSPAYIEQEGRDQLHLCFPSQTCYTMVGQTRPAGKAGSGPAPVPWYGVLWKSIRAADGVPAK
jgi:cell division protein FtsB